TPSEAAELAVPLQTDVLATLSHWRGQLATNLKQRARQIRLQLDSLAGRPALTRPMDLIHNRASQLDELDRRLKRSTRELVSRLQTETRHLAASLEALSPLKVLSRGYSITRRGAESKESTPEIVKSVDQLQPGDTITTKVSDGSITSQVQELHPDPEESS
ncbi:MAG: exodeoxyribonuclease VII large subunit, partial [Gimesia chilikensis]